MLTKIKDILFLVLLLGALALATDQGCRKLRYKRSSELFKAYYDSCVNAPVVVTIRDSIIYLKDTTKYYPTPTVIYAYGDTLFDTIVQDTCGVNSWYSQKYEWNDSTSMKWGAHVYGTIDWINFDSLTLPFRTIHEERTVQVLRDCPKVKHFRWGGYAGAHINNIIKFPMPEVGLIFSFRNGGIMIGATYDVQIGKLYFAPKGFLYFNTK